MKQKIMRAVKVAQIVPRTLNAEGEETSFEYTIPVSAKQSGDEDD